ncbi:hypothetical protein F5051DRAFT_74056 [Lentinula edodes]|nr:hypothetical protein F5051DRAFT_74056 [Lentinula edodes]
MVFLRSRIQVYTVLVFGLFYDACNCAAMPLSQSELSTRADSAEQLQEVSFLIRFTEPEANERQLYDVQNKDLTVKQIQTYMDRVAVGFGFRPMVHIHDATGTPYRKDETLAVQFSFWLKPPLLTQGVGHSCSMAPRIPGPSRRSHSDQKKYAKFVNSFSEEFFFLP